MLVPKSHSFQTNLCIFTLSVQAEMLINFIKEGIYFSLKNLVVIVYGIWNEKSLL